MAVVKKAVAALLLVLVMVPAAEWAEAAWRREKCGKCKGTGRRREKNRWCWCPKCDGKGWLMKHYSSPQEKWERADLDRECLGGIPVHDLAKRWKHCFVATAAYGSTWEPQVAALRRFRDQCLLQSPVGQGFVALYYAVSPPLADAIGSRPWARALTRVALTPVVVIARACAGDPAAIALLLGVGGFGLALHRFRRALKRRQGALAG